VRKRRRGAPYRLAPAVLISAFAVYRAGMHLPTYFMWYLLPFAALFFYLWVAAFRCLVGIIVGLQLL
jgi:hypothetical protein